MGPTFVNRLTFPYLFGIMTNWFQDRADYMNAVNKFMTATDYAANNHMFPQGCKKKWYIEAASARPQFLQIFKCTVKCSGDVASAAYMTPTTTTMAGPSLIAYSALAATLWDQRMRDPTVAGKIASGTLDTILASNSSTGVAVNVPVAGTGNVWEAYDPTTNTRLTESGGPPSCKEKLSWIFPGMKKKVHVKQVFKKWMKPWERITFEENESWPHMLTPQQLEDINAPTYIAKQSHFYFVRAFSAPDIAYNGGGIAAGTNVPKRRERPVQFIIQLKRTIGARISGDHLPNYTVSDHVVAPLATGVSTTVTQQEAAATNATSGGVEISTGGVVFAPIWGNGYI